MSAPLSGMFELEMELTELLQRVNTGGALWCDRFGQYGTGAVRAEHTYSGTSCGSLTMEVGKPPTATPRRAELPVA
eukprot:scaffold61127_cov41-Phaeocystis_antarctica.AAC.2